LYIPDKTSGLPGDLLRSADRERRYVIASSALLHGAAENIRRGDLFSAPIFKRFDNITQKIMTPHPMHAGKLDTIPRKGTPVTRGE
jgi:hypothetical protein